jgi:FkbM family methyltransferase
MLARFKNVLSLTGQTPTDSFFINLAKLVFLVIRVFTIHTNIGRYLLKDSIAKTSYGYFYCRKRSGDLGMISESFEADVMKVFKPKEGDAVIDVGANVGKYTVLASKLVGKRGKVLAVEPEIGAFKILQKNIELNGLKNVIPLEYAAWNRNQRLRFFYHDSSSSSAKVRSKNSYLVDAKRLDTIMKESNLQHVDGMKIDVEGADLEVLQGADLKNVRNVVLEFSKENESELIRIFKRNSFSIKNLSSTYMLARKIPL